MRVGLGVRILVIDFGLAVVGGSSEVCGTIGYMSVDVLEGKP
jgi:hypothetical protein